MNNILYLDDYINLYSNDKLIVFKPYKHTLINGKICNNDKFIKSFNKLLEINNIKNRFFSEKIYIIINNNYNDVDKNNIKEIMNSLNYQKVYFINELDYLDINKNKLLINYNYSYFYIIYTNDYGDTCVNLYKLDNINKDLIINVINTANKKEIIIYGKNYKELETILNRENKDYYVYEYAENLLVKILCKVH